MTINMQQFFQVFFEETDELLSQMESLLMGLDIANPDSETLNAIFRVAHSIKGGASTFGLQDLTSFTHVLESLLDKLRKRELNLTNQHIDAFLDAKDVLTSMVDGHRLGLHVDRGFVAGVEKNLVSLSGAVNTNNTSITTSLNPVLQRYVRVLFNKVSDKDYQNLKNELALCGEVQSVNVEGRVGFEIHTEESIDNVASICAFVVNLEDMDVTEASGTDLVVYDAGDGYGFFEPVDPLVVEEGEGYGFFVKVSPNKTLTQNNATKVEQLHAHEGKAQTSTEGTTSIRVNIDKVDDLINLVGELVITEAMISACLSKLDPGEHANLLNRVSQLTRNTRSLQESVMSIRMMPMDYVFSRFPRMVRELSSKLDKQVELVTQGASTELDKGLIEKITDPLTHIIRNSIDHGIESPAERVLSGKNAVGKITLSATHSGGHIIVAVADDGAGLQREKILNKARLQGLAVPQNPTDSEIWQLIFEPGFSTAEVVTDVSGRGVGMDVVKRNIQAMGGSVGIQSAPGFGTAITLSVPLTLAILDGMSVRVGSDVYILPLNYVLESVQSSNVHINTIAGTTRVVQIRGEYLPLISMCQYFDVNAEDELDPGSMLVIVESDNKRCALLVDELVGQQQVVVKNLETNYKRVPGISGATILGDGSVSLIIDVNAMIKEVGSIASPAEANVNEE